jgi:hypothetical protein
MQSSPEWHHILCVGTKTEDFFVNTWLLNKTGIQAVVEQTFILLSLTVTLKDLINFFITLQLLRFGTVTA